MKRTIFTFFGFVALAGFLRGQTATDPNEGARLFQDSANTYTFKWWGRAGQTYFIQTSPDLFTWVFLNEIEPGENLIIPYGFTSTADKFFVRVKYTDQPTDDRFNSDFDGDGISNADELSAGSDPLSNVDSDTDGLPDDWEKFWFSGSLLRDGTGDNDSDGFTDKEEFLFGLNPNADDSATSAKDLSYDALGRLQTAGAVTYTYDAEGNIETAAD